MPDLFNPPDMDATDQPQQPAAQPQAQPPAQSSQSLDDTRAILSGQSGSKSPEDAGVDAANAAAVRPRTGLFARILYSAMTGLKGAGEGLAMNGIPGAVEGAVLPKTANTQWQQRQQLAASNVDFYKARAAYETTEALSAHNVMERQTEEWKQAQSDRAINKMMEFQNLGLSPSEFPDDHSADASRVAQDFISQGKIPYVLHAPSADGQHGQLIVYDLSPLLKAQTMSTAVKAGLALTNDPTTDSDFAKMNPQQRLAVTQKGLTGIDYAPAGTPGEILNQINQLTSLKRVYATAHTNDPDLKSTLAKYDSSIQSLQQARKNLLSGASEEGKAKAQIAGEVAEATGERQKNLAEANKANQEATSATAISTPDSLGFTPNIAQVGGVKNYESIQKSFKKNADDLSQTEQTFQQFNAILGDVNAGKDLTGAQSVVGLFNAIGISAEPLKGKGFRINNSTVEEHANARGLGDSLYQRLLRLKAGDVITPQQLKDYATIATQAREQKYVTLVNEAHNEGLNADFLLPAGNGQHIDPSTAKIFLTLTGGDKDKARAAASKKGWVL
jgi:hypothetical protein